MAGREAELGRALIGVESFNEAGHFHGRKGLLHPDELAAKRVASMRPAIFMAGRRENRRIAVTQACASMRPAIFMAGREDCARGGRASDARFNEAGHFHGRKDRAGQAAT